MSRGILVLCCLQAILWAQEAPSGFELGATIGTAADYTHQLAAQPRDSGPLTGGFRAMLYPTWKLSKHWAVTGAVQVSSRPYFFEQFSTQGYGVKADVLQANLSYSQFWNDGSVIVRLGQLPSAFGSFLLRYDDAVNPLIDVPMAYGYYGSVVSEMGLTGAQADVTLRRLDLRAQFATSSPINPRSITEPDQYGNWAGGVGYTIRQGFRVGASTYYGPYLDRHFAFFFPGEIAPRNLPASAYGVDVQWAGGPWNVYGELQRFQMDYTKIPTFKEHTGYAEIKRMLNPRWYAAARLGYLRNSFSGRQAYEFALGFRPNRYQLLKVGYEIQQGTQIRGTLANTVSMQLVTSFHPISIARN